MEKLLFDYENECYRLLKTYPLPLVHNGIRSAKNGDITWRNLYVTLCRTLMVSG